MRHRSAAPGSRRRAGDRRAPWRRALVATVAVATVLGAGAAVAVTVQDPPGETSGAAADAAAAAVRPTAAPSATPGYAAGALSRRAAGYVERRSEPAVAFRLQEGERLERIPPPPPPEPPAEDAADLAAAAEDAASPSASPSASAPPAAPAPSGSGSGSGSLPSFTVSMYNVQGSNHAPGGIDRVVRGVSMATGRGASIIGFSELQPDQLGAARRAAPAFSFFPQGPNSRYTAQAVGWNTGVWTLQETRLFSVPFNDGPRPQPIVRLRSRATGQDLWVVNVHNASQGREAQRDAAQRIEVGVIRNLVATGTPVVLTGDFNEKEEALCVFTTQTALLSGVGGTGCSHPSPRVDWIFRSPSLALQGYAFVPGGSMTDHRSILFSTLRMG